MDWYLNVLFNDYSASLPMTPNYTNRSHWAWKKKNSEEGLHFAQMVPSLVSCAVSFLMRKIMFLP